MVLTNKALVKFYTWVFLTMWKLLNLITTLSIRHKAESRKRLKVISASINIMKLYNILEDWGHGFSWKSHLFHLLWRERKQQSYYLYRIVVKLKIVIWLNYKCLRYKKILNDNDMIEFAYTEQVKYTRSLMSTLKNLHHY